MICPNCHSQIPENKYDLTTTLLTIYVMIIVATQLLSQFIIYVVPEWYASPVKYIYFTLSSIACVARLLVPFCIKNRTLKIITFIVLAALTVYNVSTNIIDMLRTY